MPHSVWVLLIVYATQYSGGFNGGTSHLPGIGATHIGSYSSKEYCEEGLKSVLEMKDLWKNNPIKPFGIKCIEVK